jgi:dTDP-4-dehydrorhamnose 3,5-epimerase
MTDNDWLVPGATKEPQSVTPNWEKLDMRVIDGVVLKDVRHVPTAYGHLTELFRKDWGLAGDWTQAFQSRFQPGAVSAWHAHAITQDGIFVNSGMLKIVLFDSRKSSNTYGTLNEFKLGDARPALLIVPPYVWHGIHNASSSEASLINFVDHAYSYEDPDHWRLAADSPEIPYRFQNTSIISRSGR